MTSLFLRTGVIAAVAPLAAASAFGQVTAHPNEGTAGEYFETALNVPDGCETSPTVSLRVKIPENVTLVKPQMKSGWKMKIKTRKLAQPIKLENGRTISETIEEVNWTGGPLPGDQYDNFGLRMKLPDAAGQTLWFPVVQECKKGVRRWIDIPLPGLKRPEYRNSAPFVRIVSKAP